MISRHRRLPDESVDDLATQIVPVALEAFNAHGYAKTSLQQIADELDVTKAALYYHFPSKDELLLRSVSPLLDAIDALVHTTKRPASRDDQAAFLRGYVDVLLQHRRAAVLVGRDLVVRTRPAIAPRLVRQDNAVKRLLTGRERTIAATVGATSALGALWRPVLDLTDIRLERQTDVLVTGALAVLAQSTQRRAQRASAEGHQDGRRPGRRNTQP